MNVFITPFQISNGVSNRSKQYCNNCGNAGHILYQCKMPILSIGVIAFRWNAHQACFEYLMIRRKDTLGYIDFLRGKYALDNKEYLLRMFHQMTTTEKTRIQTEKFETLWKDLWGNNKLSNQYRIEEAVSCQRFRQLFVDGGVDKNTGITFSIGDLIRESDEYATWSEQEWGFPKGRRNTQESDYNCALREMSEETGYPTLALRNVHNIVPFEEAFIGSNNKHYKHRYYLMMMDFDASVRNIGNYQRDEVSGMEWGNGDECMAKIRGYNVEKREMFRRVCNTISNYGLYI